MRKLAIALTVLLVSSACGKKDDGKNKAEPTNKTAPTAESKPPPPNVDPALLERGGYLAGIMGCPLCHTAFTENGPAIDKMWAGGFEFDDVFGTWRSPNITQDKKTGIGDWTDEQILVAIRQGKRPDGTMMYPVMPFLYYNKLSNEDGVAIVAFLRTIPPIENAVEGNTDLDLPKMPSSPAAKGVEPGPTPLEQGEYLVTILHCHFCHTQMTDEGPDMAKSFAGGFPFKMPDKWAAAMGSGTLFSSNITSDKKTGIGDYTDEQLIAVFKEFKKKDGTPIFGPMRMYEMAWRKMKDKDAKAIVTYLRTIPAVKNKVPKGDFKPPAPPPGAPPQ